MMLLEGCFSEDVGAGRNMLTTAICTSLALSCMSDEMELDGRPRLNLATFVTTRMEDEAEELMLVSAAKCLLVRCACARLRGCKLYRT